MPTGRETAAITSSRRSASPPPAARTPRSPAGVAINIVTLDTTASVGSGATIKATAGKLDVIADQSTAIQAIAGAAALSTGGTGVGASVGLNIVVEHTTAAVGAGSQLAARDATTVGATGQVVPASFDLPGPLPDLTVSNLAISGGISTDGAAGAGSAAVNIYTLDTIARLDNGVTINAAALGVTAGAAQDVTVASKSRTNIEGGAGAGGISIGNAGVGIGLDVTVLIENTKTLLGSGVAIQAARDIAVKAASDQDITSVAATAGVATDGTGVGGSVTVYVVTNDTEATTAGGAGSALQAGGALAVTADAPFDIVQIAGALAYGNSAGVGISSTVLVHNDTVKAMVGPNTALAAGASAGADVAATSHENLVTIAVGGGASSSAAVAGSVVVNVLNETTIARVDDSSSFAITTAAGGTQSGLKIRASDQTDIVSVAGSVAASSSVGVGLGAVVNTLNKTTEARLGSGVSGLTDGDIRISADSIENIASVSAGVAASSSVGVAANANVQVLGITTRALLGDDPTDAKAGAGAGDVHAEGSIVVAADDSSDIDIITGAVGASGSAGVGAAVGVVTTTKNTAALIGEGAKVTADGLRAGLAVKDGGIGVGYVASPPMDPDNVPDAATGARPTAAQLQVGTPTFNAPDGNGNTSDDPSFTGKRVATPTLRSGFQGLAVTATNRDDINTFAVALGAGTAGIGIGSATNVVTTVTNASIGAGASVNADTSTGGAGQSVLVGAGDDFSHVALAGALGFGTVGVAPGVDVTVLSHDTGASINGGASVKAKDDVVVQANNQDHLLLISAGIAAGTVGVGGAVNVLVLDNHTAASIGALAAVSAGGDVGVLARDGTDTTLIAGAFGGGTVGIGASVGVMSITKHTDAGVLTGASIDAKGAGTGLQGLLDGSVGSGGMGTVERHGLVVQGQSSEDFFHLDVAAGVGYVGVGGGVGVSLLDSDTTAIIGANTKINKNNAGADASQGVYVTAANSASGTHFTGAVAGGFVGVGGAVQVGSLKNDTAARILGNADVTARGDVAVNGISRIDLDTLTISGAGGFVGAAAAVTVWSIGTPLERSYQNDQGATADGLTKTDGDGNQASGDTDAAKQATLAKGQVGSVLGGFSGGAAGSGQQRVHDRAGAAGTLVNGSGPSQAQWLAAINATNPAQGTEATVAGGTTITAGGAITINAQQWADVDFLVGAVGGGAGGIGAGIGVFSTAFNTNANAGGTYSAGGKLSVRTQLDSSVDAIAFAGGAGFVGLGAAVSVLSDTSFNQSALADGARVKAAASVEVSAIANRTIHLNTDQGTAGAGRGRRLVHAAERGGPGQRRRRRRRQHRPGQRPDGRRAEGLCRGQLRHLCPHAGLLDRRGRHQRQFRDRGREPAAAQCSGQRHADRRQRRRERRCDLHRQGRRPRADGHRRRRRHRRQPVLGRVLADGAGAVRRHLAAERRRPDPRAGAQQPQRQQRAGQQGRGRHLGGPGLRRLHRQRRGADGRRQRFGQGQRRLRLAARRRRARGRAGLQQQRGAGEGAGPVGRRRHRRRQHRRRACQRRHRVRTAGRRQRLHQHRRAGAGAQSRQCRGRCLRRRPRRHQWRQQHGHGQWRRADHRRRRRAGCEPGRQRRHRHRIPLQQ